jgi:hypothetical protein
LRRRRDDVVLSSRICATSRCLSLPPPLQCPLSVDGDLLPLQLGDDARPSSRMRAHDARGAGRRSVGRRFI